MTLDESFEKKVGFPHVWEGSLGACISTNMFFYILTIQIFYLHCICMRSNMCIILYVISSSSRHVFFFAAVGGIKASANTRKDWLNLDVISNLPCRTPTASGLVWHLCPDCCSRPTEYLDMELQLVIFHALYVY